MTDIKKKKIKSVLKYTWPFYIISGVLIFFGLTFIFGIAHKTPGYKTLTLFISGEVKDHKKLEDDLLLKYKDNDLKSVSINSVTPDDSSYLTRLSVVGYNASDLLIMPKSKLDLVNPSAFALDLNASLIMNYYEGYNFYDYEGASYGIKVDKSKVEQYMSLPNEDCYLLLNAKSENIGEYSEAKIKERDNALTLARDWGM